MSLAERNARMLRGGRVAAIGLADGLIENALQGDRYSNALSALAEDGGDVA
jgi:hypothetical protein